MLLITETTCTEQQFSSAEEVVLSFSCGLPRFSGMDDQPRNRLNRYYQRLAQHLLRWCAATVVSAAAEACAQCRAHCKFFEPWRVEVTWKLHSDCCICWQLTLYSGETEQIHSFADFWDFNRGFPCKAPKS